MTAQNTRKSGLNWAGAGAKPGAREVYLGVFGKHPGWDDHIDDIGLETDRLVAVKRLLYSEGIGGNIDAGAWEKLDEAQRLSSFGHELVWRIGGDVIVGRLWASRDGKGRTRYPMGVVAQCVNVPAPVIEAEIMPRLEEAERRFVAASTAAEVRQIVEDVHAQLRNAVSAGPAEDAYGEMAPPKELAAMADLPVLGEGRVGLYRVLYEIDRELGAFRPAGKSDSRRTTRFIDTRAQHLRVPACASSSFAAARQWFGVLATQIDPTASVLALRPHGKGFVDVVVGEPAAQQLFCVKASEKGLAPASEVPYTLDAEFVKKCSDLVEAWREGKREPSGSDQPAPMPVSAASEPAGGEGPAEPPPKKSWFKWAGLGAVLVLALGAVYFVTRSKDNAPPPTGAVPVAANADPGPGPAATPKTLVKSDTKAVTPPAPADPNAGKKSTDAKADPKPVTPDPSAVAEAEKKRLADEEAKRKRVADEAEKARVAEAEKKRLEDQRLAEAAAKARAAEEETRKKESLVGAAKGLAGLLDLGYGLDEETGSGTLRARGAALTGDPLFASLKDGTPEIAAVAGRLAALDTIATSTDGAFLVKQAGAGPLAERAAAWSRVAAGGAPAWPATATDLGAAGRTLDQLRKESSAVPEKARADALTARVTADGKKIWLAYFKRASPGDPQGIGAAGAVMSAFGVAREELPARARFNILLSELRRDVESYKSLKPGDSAALSKARDRIAGFSKDVSALSLGPEGAPALGVADALTKALGGAEALDPQKAGPGLRGWKGKVGTAGPVASVVYTWPAEGTPAHTIEFLRVEAPSGPAYVATTEATLGLVIDVATQSNRWSDLVGLLPDYASDPRVGVRVWDWLGGGKTIGPSKPLEGFLFEGWLPPSPKLKGVQYYPTDAVPAAPSAKSPMQAVTAPAALFTARLLGCRLPTAAEWKAAAAQPAKAKGAPNLRDATWQRTQEFLLKENATKQIVWPDDGIFIPKGVKPVRRSPEPAVETDDGVLWFSEQPAGGGGVFENLVGNVAEFVLDQPGPPDLRPDPTPEEARRAVGTKGEGVLVVGGSALSPKEIDPQTPYALDRSGAEKASFSDVGFRLAFSVAGGSTPAPPDVAGLVATIKYFPWGE